MRLRLRLPDPLAPGLPRMVSLSLLAHLLLGVVAMTLPPILPSRRSPDWNPVLVGSLVEWPVTPPAAAAAGIPAKGHAPAPRPQAKPSIPPPPEKKPPPKKKHLPKKRPVSKKTPAVKMRSAAARASSEPPQETGPDQPIGSTGSPTIPSDHPDGIGLSFQGTSFGYTYYNGQLINKLRSNWQRPILIDGLSAPVSTRVFFRIHQSGEVSQIRLEKPSSSADLDRSALRAVQQAAPFPPLPPQFTREHLDLAITFTLEPSGL